MSEGSLGVAFVGCGMVSPLHRAAVCETPGLRLVGVHDRDPDRTRARAEEWGVRAYSSVPELLEDGAVDAVYVLTPAASHVAVALLCLEAGRHVLVEKPVAHAAEEIERLEQAGRAARRVVMPAHNYAYTPEFQRLHRLLRGGELGRVRGVWVHYALRHPEEIAAAYSGVLDEVMIHHAYLALSLLGPPQHLHAGLHPGAWERLRQEDQAWMVWEYEGGETASLFATFAADDESSEPWTFQVKVLGTEGSAAFNWRGVVARNRSTPWFAWGLPIYEETYRHEAGAFRAAVTEGAPLLSSPAAAAACCRLIGAAREAAEHHEVVHRGETHRW